MANILIVTCNKIRDINCVACLKCFKAAEMKDGEFAKYDDAVNIVAMCGCGDCPGLVMPKMTLVLEQADYLERDIDAVHFGTCMLKANKTAACPIDLDKTAELIKKNMGKPVTIGTHNY